MAPRATAAVCNYAYALKSMIAAVPTLLAAVSSTIA